MTLVTDVFTDTRLRGTNAWSERPISDAVSAAIAPLELNTSAVSPLCSSAPRSSSAPFTSARKRGAAAPPRRRARVDPSLEGLIQHHPKIARAQRRTGVGFRSRQSRSDRRMMREHVAVVVLVPALVDRHRGAHGLRARAPGVAMAPRRPADGSSGDEPAPLERAAERVDLGEAAVGKDVVVRRPVRRRRVADQQYDRHRAGRQYRSFTVFGRAADAPSACRGRREGESEKWPSRPS
jgi:hypothetical protein